MPFTDRPLPADFELPAIVPRKPKVMPRKPKGATALITRDLKRGIVDAATNVGSDGDGAGGLTGFLEDLARHHKKAFASLLGKVLPLTVGADNPSAVMVGNIVINSIPSGHFIAEKDGVMHTIEHAPQPTEATPAETTEERMRRIGARRVV